jgi:uncharacterized membrane protein HdeD (DUF308 family)
VRRLTDLAWWRWRLPAGAPRLLSGLLGLVCVTIGLFLVIRPLTSLDTLTLTIGVGLVVSGLADVLTSPTPPEIQTETQTKTPSDTPNGVPAKTPPDTPNGSPAMARSGPGPATARMTRAAGVAVAIGWVVLGVVVLIRRGVGLTALVWLVGAALVVSGLARIATSVRTPRPGGERAAAVLLGIASLIVGVLALAWPDVTMLVVAVIFGARTVWFGLAHLWASVRPHRSEPRSRTRRPSLIVAILAVVAAVAAAGVSAWIHAGQPVVDAFYAAPGSVPADPGELIRSEPFTREVPDGARAWRILYTTTDALGTPRTASALVVVPDDTSPHPVIAWTHGTTGYAPPCAPSLARQPFESGALFVVDQVIDRGWALVATDYAGLGTPAPQPYLIGKGEARSELDAVRAARHLDGTALAQQTVVWGHSQGGHAALWTGEIAADYAPDVPLDGVAALAPASDLTAFAGELTSITGGSVFASYVIAAYSQTYSDVNLDDYVRASARTVVQRMSTRCLAEPGILASVLAAVSLSADPVIWSRDPTTGPLGERLAQNVPTGPFAAPVLIGQGAADTLILPSMQRKFVRQLCSSHPGTGTGTDTGQAIDYRSYPGKGHVSLVEAGSPAITDLFAWTADRFAGRSASSDCASLPG